jgi:cyanobactin cluster PatC/TenC/TruC protein
VIAHDKTRHGNHGTIQVHAMWEVSNLAFEANLSTPTDSSPPVATPSEHPVSPVVNHKGIETMAKTTAPSTAHRTPTPGYGSVLSLGDNHQGIVARSAALKPQGRFTIEAWIYPTTHKDKQVIFSEGESLFYVEKGELKFQNASSEIASVGAGITSGNWYHVAVARGAKHSWGNTKLYINGKQNDNQAVISPVLTVGSTYIGSQPDVTDSRFQGKLLEIRVWRFARPQADIQTNMTYFLTGRELGLVRCWTVNEGFGNTIGDRTTNHAGGTIMGDATWEEGEIPIKINLNAQERLTRSTGLEDYSYWFGEMAKEQKTEAEPYFRRGRIWS